MAEYDNNLRGALFPSTQKKSDKSPDYSGSCEINGVEYRIAGWKRVSKQGNIFLSLAFTDKAERPSKPVEDNPEEPF